MLAALENIPSVQPSVQTEAEQEQTHAPLPWQSFHGDAVPLAASQMQSLFQNDPQGHEKFLSSIDATTRRLVGEARTRDALLHLASRINSSEYAKPLHDAASETTAQMAIDMESLAPTGAAIGSDYGKTPFLDLPAGRTALHADSRSCLPEP